MTKIMIFLMLSLMSLSCLAQYTLNEMKILENDKEVMISSFNNKERKDILLKYTDQAVTAQYAEIFYETMLGFLNSENKRCEFRLINNLHQRLSEEKIATNEKDIEEFLKVLRVKHSIDDILYELLSEINHDYFGLIGLDLNQKGKKLLLGHKKLLGANDLPELFSEFATFPDEESKCLIQEYNRLFNKIRKSDGRKSLSLKDFKTLTIKALELKLITLPAFHKIRYLQTKSKINKRSIWLNDYLNIIFNAKNKMVPVRYVYKPRKIEDEDDFSSERIKRFSKITRRKLLYQKYDETQIILLAQVLQKASRRMGVDADTESGTPYISQEFTITQPDGQRRTYVETIDLDPQSQYNLARRLLRKDVVDLQMMDIFVKQKITHDDIVMAALETGYISLEELEFVVQYDDLWNPEISKFERISGFIFTMAGYSSFFLPPPWNITASIALGVVEGVVNNKFKNGADNDNPATFIE